MTGCSPAQEGRRAARCADPDKPQTAADGGPRAVKSDQERASN